MSGELLRAMTLAGGSGCTVVSSGGSVRCVYGEDIDLAAIGSMNITRASHVEPDERGQWWAEIVEGPKLGPFPRRSDALAAEVAWLTEQRLAASR